MADMLMTCRAIALEVAGGDRAVRLTSGQELAEPVEGDPVGAAEPIDHQRHEHLRVELEDPAHEGVVGGAAGDEDDLAHQPPPPSGLTPGALGGLGDDSPELDDEQGTDEPVEVVVAAVDGHPGHSGPTCDLGQGQSAKADLENPVVGSAEHRIRRCGGAVGATAEM